MATFVNDTFTDTDGTVLSSHTGETGATWTLDANTTSDWVISDANRARPNNSSGRSQYVASGTPASAEYDVLATLRVVTMISGQYCGVTGRVNTVNADGYEAMYSQADGAWLLGKRVAAAFTQLGSYTQTLSAGNDYALKLEIRDATKKVYIDGVERISSVDNAVTATGKAGVQGISIASTNTTGMHLADFTASDPVSGRARLVDGNLVSGGALVRGLLS